MTDCNRKMRDCQGVSIFSDGKRELVVVLYQTSLNHPGCHSERSEESQPGWFNET